MSRLGRPKVPSKSFRVMVEPASSASSCQLLKWASAESTNTPSMSKTTAHFMMDFAAGRQASADGRMTGRPME